MTQLKVMTPLALSSIEQMMKKLEEANIHDSLRINLRTHFHGARFSGKHVLPDKYIPVHEACAIVDCDWLPMHREVIRQMELKQRLLRKAKENDELE